MKLAFVVHISDSAIDCFEENTDLSLVTSYREHLQCYFDFHSTMDGTKQKYFRQLGIEAESFYYNYENLQNKWKKEYQPGLRSSDDILIAQLRAFEPDVILFAGRKHLLQRVKSDVPSIRLVVGWSGSAFRSWNFDPHLYNLILTCAKENLPRIREQSYRVELVEHVFDCDVIKYLVEHPKNNNIIFTGGLVSGPATHDYRIQLVTSLCKAFPNFNLYTEKPSETSTWKRHLFKLKQKWRSFSRFIRRKITWEDLKLQATLQAILYTSRTPVFGIPMYQACRDSEVSLNVHANSSPLYASNMRLFETAGAGGCTLTDWKTNIKDIFEQDYEVVTYNSIDECIEKAQWLHDHPMQREEIAQAGQKRCLRDHTPEKQVGQIHDAIRKYL